MHSQKSFFYSSDQFLHLTVSSVVDNWVLSENPRLSSISAPMLSSNSFTGPGLTVRPLTHFQLFLYIMRDSNPAPLFRVTFPRVLCYRRYSPRSASDTSVTHQ